MKRLLAVLALVVVILVGAASASAFTQTLKGKIGKYPVVMTITVNTNTGVVTGKYRYTRSKGGWLKLTGEVTGGGQMSGCPWVQVSMWERNPQGEVTGTFDLTVNECGFAGGDFTNYKGQTFDVDLKK